LAERLQDYASRCATNQQDLCELEPRAFAQQVISSEVAADGGSWVQPIYRKVGLDWQLSKCEVLYRLSDARGVPFPAFVNFVKAATDETPNPDPDLRGAFCAHAVTSLHRVDGWLSQLGAAKRNAMASAGLMLNFNVTAKQLESALLAPLQNRVLISLEETEYDAEPANLSEIRQKAWQTFAGLSIDDVKPTFSEVVAFTEEPVCYTPPVTPTGKPFKPLALRYNHDIAFTRRFISEFQRAREANPSAQSDLKLDEEFCCYLIGVGHAPFSRSAMADWRQRHPGASKAVRALGVALIREALEAGMGICLEVSFDDAEVQWLVDELPHLRGRLFKQGGRSGSVAVPPTLLLDEIVVPRAGRLSSKAPYDHCCAW
jgi:hypothetical protein